ncbi:MAG: MurT ligase domain-containing protein [Eggerthellaceae bacterium]|nr:MurT ligase domain-containing protein [Eggerthellaceae bacterium]
MGLQFGLAKGVSATLTWGLRNIFHRPAANTPGKIALYVDPQLIAHLRPRLGEGSIVVVGTNGKTTVTNLIADVLERAGKSVVCNRTGANLDSGVSTVMLQTPAADWGVFESDELWLAKILPQLRANYVVLLNLFRDQLDRCGEIDRIQDSIVGALASSPETVLVYNADDPLCAMIAERAGALPKRAGTRSIAFGVEASMGLAQNVVTDATMCQRCSSMFEYVFRQYGQLGEYRCPNCGFARPALDWAACDVRLGADGLAFELRGGAAADGSEHADAGGAGDVAHDGGAREAFPVRAAFSGAYMVYNLMAVGVAARLLGCDAQAVQRAIDAFDPKNGRLQEYAIGGRRVLLNLAKNPTGFNQNLKIVAQDAGPKAVAFFINDKEADGRDISWIWDIDFEELVAQEGCVVFAGGIRKNDLQVRLKYAGVQAQLVDGIDDVFAALGAGAQAAASGAGAADGRSAAALPADAGVYAIANYTALPGVKASLDALAASDAGQAPCACRQPESAGASSGETAETAAPESSSASSGCAVSPTATEVTIAHMFPDLLNLYGDGGNVRVLEQRLRWRGVPVRVERVCHGDHVDLSQTDLVFLGGGPDREQKLASEELLAMRDDIARFVEEDGALLAICGGYQILGSVWLLGEDEVPGLGIVDAETRRPGTSADRLIDNIVLRSSVATRPVVGYENHAGRTYLGAGARSFGTVVSSTGHGNNDDDKADGVLYRGVVGTYSHGPLLSKNPEVADYLLERALARHAARTGEPKVELMPLDDAEEAAANEYMAKRLGC